MSEKQELFSLIKERCYQYKEGGFNLSAGGRSQHYFDLRNITLDPDSLAIICRNLIYEFAENKINYPSALGGLTMGSDPIIYSLTQASWQQNQIMYPLIVRKEPKAHGAGKLVEGLIDKLNPKTCVVIDDVCTTGSSTLKAVMAIRNLGIEINHAFCILDRQEGGKELLRGHSIQLYSLFKKEEFGIGA